MDRSCPLSISFIFPRPKSIRVRFALKITCPCNPIPKSTPPSFRQLFRSIWKTPTRAICLAQSWQRMWEPTVLPSGETCFYGYGFERRRVYGLTVIDHDGGISGFTSYSARTPDRSLFVCVLSNNDSAEPTTIDVGETIIRALSACRAHTQSEFLKHEHVAT